MKFKKVVWVHFFLKADSDSDSDTQLELDDLFMVFILFYLNILFSSVIRSRLYAILEIFVIFEEIQFISKNVFERGKEAI